MAAGIGYLSTKRRSPESEPDDWIFGRQRKNFCCIFRCYETLRPVLMMTLISHHLAMGLADMNGKKRRSQPTVRQFKSRPYPRTVVRRTSLERSGRLR